VANGARSTCLPSLACFAGRVFAGGPCGRRTRSRERARERVFCAYSFAGRSQRCREFSFGRVCCARFLRGGGQKGEEFNSSASRFLAPLSPPPPEDEGWNKSRLKVNTARSNASTASARDPINYRGRVSRPVSDVDVSTIADYLALLISGASANAGVRSHLVVSGYSYT